MSVCVCVWGGGGVGVCGNSKNNGSVHLKLEHVVAYENSSDEFNIGHCAIKVKVKIFLHLPQYKLSSPLSQLWHRLESCD